ncbi:efflux RND transporter permease subunit [Notoacmeibacter ruber]|uniref:Efflux RND transporter permease subunit n=1 Tax=Notoacmeibacter ruber TaxID=2670375 RepID=A0A3L7JGE0_9HYPH|nr:efflux RND transporter permease subunit [Notoacmeibacter ruber]RLQ89534.1 efflux RND transporter permease subunit [Notoacmeibacter ruber]
MATSGTALFIRRPVFALVVNLLIIVAGLAGIYGGEVRELPDVDRPVVSIRTDWSGAAPEAVDREITAVIESAAARISGVETISSSSSQGSSRVMAEFSSSTDISVAAADLRDAVAQVVNQLPDDAEEPRIVKADSDAEAVMRIAVTSERLGVADLTVLVEDEVVDRLNAVEGVADIEIYGEKEKIFLIDLDPDALAARGLSPGDLTSVFSSLSFDVPAGSLTSGGQDLVVRAQADVTSAEDFEALILADRVRLGDVARVTLGPDLEGSNLRANGQTGVGMGVIRQASSNTLTISDGVRAAVAEIQQRLPDGVAIRVTSDDATFVRGAITEVRNSLLIAVAVVVVVIFLFLLDWRATLIPTVTIPVALLGTFGAIWLAGFSINILTLLALVLATGMVVDDAIVVLENIVRKRNAGFGPRAAAVLGVREVFFAVIATTATLIAVFVPVSFLPGQSGSLFGEFGFVLAFSVTLSSFVALTLCPMLASRMLKARNESEEKAPGLARRFGSYLERLYASTLRFALAFPFAIILAMLAFAASAWIAFQNVDRELLPQEDRSIALLSVRVASGVAPEYTEGKLKQIESLLEPLRERGEVQNIFSFSGSNRGGGFMVLTLAPWEERERSQNDIVNDINAAVGEVAGVRAFAIQPNSLGIRGAGRGLRVALVGPSYRVLGETAENLVDQLKADPRFSNPRQNYSASTPQLSVQIDRERASDLGIDFSGLSTAIQAMLDGREVGSVFIADRAFPVKLVSTTRPINDPTDLENIYLKANGDRMVPLSSIASLTETSAASSLDREEQQRAVTVTVSPDDMALATALDELTAIAEPLLPSGVRMIPLSEAAVLDKSTTDLIVTFSIAILIVLFVLAAQFESFLSALIIMATVPIGLACAIWAMALLGVSFNVYSQIGLVLLVGVMAKNGILVVEFANQLRNMGRSVREAVEEAAVLRLRPVMMTMISTIFGAVPLILSSGAGAEARNALGYVIVGGLGLSTVATLYLTPVVYLLLARFAAPSAEEAARLRRELARAEQLAPEEVA